MVPHARKSPAPTRPDAGRQLRVAHLREGHRRLPRWRCIAQAGVRGHHPRRGRQGVVDPAQAGRLSDQSRQLGRASGRSRCESREVGRRSATREPELTLHLVSGHDLASNLRNSPSTTVEAESSSGLRCPVPGSCTRARSRTSIQPHFVIVRGRTARATSTTSCTRGQCFDLKSAQMATLQTVKTTTKATVSQEQSLSLVRNLIRVSLRVRARVRLGPPLSWRVGDVLLDARASPPRSTTRTSYRRGSLKSATCAISS